MNTLSIIIIIIIAAGVFFALRAMIVKKAGRCGGRSGCEGCALKEQCTKKQKK